MTTLPDKYTNIYPIKPGQNAAVYKATNALTGREVFLKIYPVPKDDPLSAIRDPHLLRKLEHRNLARIYSADPNTSGGIILEMELLGDGSVDDCLRHSIITGEWLRIHTAISIVRDIADGLNHLHGLGYVHRDIKPANIMLRKGGLTPEGVITDMGLVSKLDNHGQAQGTKHARLYRPPEIWQNRPYTIASDVYQVGLILYQLAGGQLNYQLSSLPDATLGPKILSGALVDLDTLGIHVNSSLARLIEQLLSDTQHRLPDCNCLISELQLIQRDHSDWSLATGASTMCACRASGKREVKVEIASITPNESLAQVFERPKGGNWRRKGKEVKVQHKTLRHCRKIRALLDK